LLSWGAAMRTFVYVDVFNLCYGALEGTLWKWLDLVALFKIVLTAPPLRQRDGCVTV